MCEDFTKGKYSLKILTDELNKLKLEKETRLDDSNINHSEKIKRLECKILDLEFAIDFLS